MKIVLLAFTLLTLLTSCTNSDRTVNVAKEASAKTVMITIPSEVQALRLSIKDGRFQIERGTVTVNVSGSGVFISPTGHVLTAAHLRWAGKPGEATICQQNGECSTGELLFQEDALDLALFKVKTVKRVPYAKLANPLKLRVGQAVLAIGYPLGFEWTVSHGIISGLYRSGLGVTGMTQSDTSINPGNSGGPLFNMKGELVGINSRMVPPVNAPIFTGLGFSVSVREILAFLERFRGLEEAF